MDGLAGLLCAQLGIARGALPAGGGGEMDQCIAWMGMYVGNASGRRCQHRVA
jgi:hypothetical protein